MYTHAHANFGRRKLRDKANFGNLNVDYRIILKWILEKVCEDVNRIELVQDRI
jgi:hypothetical protein